MTAIGSRISAIRPLRTTRIHVSRRAIVTRIHASSLKDARLQPATATQELPDAPGVYAVYDKMGKLQYVGLSRRIAASVAAHRADLPDETIGVKVHSIPDASKETLQEAWKTWVTEHVEATGDIPPGNAPGVTTWTQRRNRPVRAEIRLTPGKGIQDVTVPMEKLVDQVVKSVPVVAFVKGTRTEPQCGFSHRMLTALNNTKVEYEVVNVLDDVHNPGLRETIKAYSSWPTIPQLYVKGEFIGGADIVEEMNTKGGLLRMLQTSGAKFSQ